MKRRHFLKLGIVPFLPLSWPIQLSKSKILFRHKFEKELNVGPGDTLNIHLENCDLCKEFSVKRDNVTSLWICFKEYIMILNPEYIIEHYAVDKYNSWWRLT